MVQLMQDNKHAPSGDLQSRLISPCARLAPENRQAIPDVAAIFRRLILFDTYIVQTIRFKEFVPLARTLGIDNVLKLLDSGALQLELDPTQIIQVGQMSDGPTFSTGAPPLPLLSYRFTFLRAANTTTILFVAYRMFGGNCMVTPRTTASPNLKVRSFVRFNQFPETAA
jgi:hypothetical protein